MDGLVEIAKTFGWEVAAGIVVGLLIIWLLVHLFAAQEGKEVSFFGIVRYTKRFSTRRTRGKKTRIRPIEDQTQQLVMIAYGVSDENSAPEGWIFSMLQKTPRAEFDLAVKELVKGGYLQGAMVFGDYGQTYYLTEAGLRWIAEHREMIDETREKLPKREPTMPW